MGLRPESHGTNFDKRAVLREHPIFRVLGPELIERLASYAHTKTVAAGTTIFAGALRSAGSSALLRKLTRALISGRRRSGVSRNLTLTVAVAFARLIAGLTSTTVPRNRSAGDESSTISQGPPVFTRCSRPSGTSDSSNRDVGS